MQDKDVTFDQSQVVYYRTMFLLASILYPLWYFVVNWLVPGSRDFLSQRILVGTVIFVGFLWSFHPKSSHLAIKNLFIFYANLVCAHIYYLVALNNFAGFYQLVAIVAFSCIAAAMPNTKLLAIFITFNVATASGIAFWNNDSFTALLFTACVLTVGFTFWPPLSMRMKLLGKINLMRRELDIIVSNVAAGIVKTDTQGAVNNANNLAHQIFGIKEGQLVGRSFLDLFVEKNRVLIRDILSKLVSGNFQDNEFTVKVIKKEQVIWIRVRCSPVIERGIVTGSIWVINDVTAEQENQFIVLVQKSMLEILVSPYDEKHLAEATTNILNRYLDESPTLLWKLTSEESNRFVVQGITGHVVVDDRFNDLLVRNIRSIIFQSSSEFVIDVETLKEDYQIERFPVVWLVPVKEKSGSFTDFLTVFRETKEEPKNFEKRMIETALGLYKVGLDKLKAEQKVLAQQTQITQSAKMASLGEMAGGIAHEINNPLAVLRGRFEQMKALVQVEKINKDHIERYTESGIQMVDRLKKIIQGLRQFSRDGSKDPFTPLNLMDVIQDTLVFCKEKFAMSGVEIICDIPKEIPQINGRHTQISQVILNVLNNAFDAVSQQKEKWVKIQVNQIQSKVQLSITDSGKGISNETLERIFQPFFTTKSLGQGTGLGLSISLGIIKDHGGTIFYNKSDPNTQFIIELPAIQPGINQENSTQKAA